MTVSFIELNDSEIRISRDGRVILASPGFAVINNDRITLGAEAVRQARLNPRATYNRFWSNLGQDSLKHQTRSVRHNADLAFAHLNALHEQAGSLNEVVFAVPGSFSNNQLALLLGLSEASPFNAIGLVDSAVAAAAHVAGSGVYLHAEIHLHEVVVTGLEVAGGHVSRTSIQVIEEAGLCAIHDTCARIISDLFIRQSRFDPQRHAETEQLLYDQIPACLESLRNHDEIALEIPYQQARHHARLPAHALLDGLEPVYHRIRSVLAAAPACLVGDRLASLPGFQAAGPGTCLLDRDAVFRGCREQLLKIRSEGPALDFITRLPASTSPRFTTGEPDRTTPAPATLRPVTHILHDHHAYPLDGGRRYLTAAGGVHESPVPDARCSVLLQDGRVLLTPEGDRGVFNNGQPCRGTVRAGAGDTVTFPGSRAEYTLICVVE